MEFIVAGVRHAIALLGSGDPTVLAAVVVSLQLSLTSTALAAMAGLPLGYLIGSHEFRGRRLTTTILHSLMSVPTVTIGLLVYALCSHRGPLGELGWLYTKKAMIFGQVLLALPLTAALGLAATRSLDPRLRETAASLGAGPWQVMCAALYEGRHAYMVAVVTAFGRVVSEVGIAMMAGGNIRGSTRTITTAIALESSRGEFARGLALGLILVALAFTITGVSNALDRRGGTRA